MRARFGIRLVVRKAMKSGTITRQQAKAMLRDGDKLELLGDLAGEKIGESLGDEEDGPLLRILRFLLENQEALKALIEMIISLFADNEIATEAEIDAIE